MLLSSTEIDNKTYINTSKKTLQSLIRNIRNANKINHTHNIQSKVSSTDDTIAYALADAVSKLAGKRHSIRKTFLPRS